MKTFFEVIAIIFIYMTALLLWPLAIVWVVLSRVPDANDQFGTQLISDNELMGRVIFAILGVAGTLAWVYFLLVTAGVV